MEIYKHHQHQVTYIGLGILAYFLLIEHREHVFPLLPYLILLACPFLHMFMHKRHRHQNHAHREKEQRQ